MRGWDELQAEYINSLHQDNQSHHQPTTVYRPAAAVVERRVTSENFKAHTVLLQATATATATATDSVTVAATAATTTTTTTTTLSPAATSPAPFVHASFPVPPPPFHDSIAPFHAIEAARTAAQKWRRNASRDRLQSSAVNLLRSTAEGLEFSTIEQLPSIESLHKMVVACADLKWSNCLYSAHIIVQEEAKQGEFSPSYNRWVQVPQVDPQNEHITWWESRSQLVHFMQQSIPILAHVLVSQQQSILSVTLLDAIVYQVLTTVEQRELLLAEVCKRCQKQYPQYPSPPLILQRLLKVIVHSSTSQQYVRNLFRTILQQIYKNVDRSRDKQPTSRASRQTGCEVEQTQRRILRAILNSTLELPPLVQAACCILSDAGYDASNFFLGKLICGSLSDTLFLPYITVVTCGERHHTNDMTSGAQNVRVHLRQVAFVLERVFGVTNGVTNLEESSEEFGTANTLSLVLLANKYGFTYGPRIFKYVNQLLDGSALAFRDHVHRFRLNYFRPVMRGLFIREQDLMDLCHIFLYSKYDLVGDKKQSLRSIISSSGKHPSRTVLVIPIISGGNISTMNWREMVKLDDFDLYNISWGDAARKLNRIHERLAQSSHLAAISQRQYLSDAELQQAKDLSQEMQAADEFLQHVGEIIHHVYEETARHNDLRLLLEQQSSGMLLRHLSTNTVDDGLLPLYRPLRNSTDSIFSPKEHEDDLYLDSAGARHHTKHGDPLNVRSQKYIRGVHMNDRLRVEDRPHGWKSPVARIRIKKIEQVNNRKLQKECSFAPNLTVQRAAVANLLKFKEKAGSVEVSHAERPQWNTSRVLGTDLSARFVKAETNASEADGKRKS